MWLNILVCVNPGQNFEKDMLILKEIQFRTLYIISVLIENGSCLYPYTVQEHKRNIQQKLMEPCLPPGTLVWNNITHSHIQVLLQWH